MYIRIQNVYRRRQIYKYIHIKLYVYRRRQEVENICIEGDKYILGYKYIFACSRENMYIDGDKSFVKKKKNMYIEGDKVILGYNYVVGYNCICMWQEKHVYVGLQIHIGL